MNQKPYLTVFTFVSLTAFSLITELNGEQIASPASVGMSPARLRRITTEAEQQIADGKLVGIVSLVARHGKIVYHKAFGMADNEASRELKKDDIFRIASQSKAITSTAVMMLWELARF